MIEPPSFRNFATRRVRFQIQLSLVFACLVASQRDLRADDWRTGLQPFLATHCLECHQGREAAGEFDIAKLDTDLADAEVMRRWTRIHDRIASGEMPPAGQPKIETAAIKQTLRELNSTLTQADLTRNDVVYRRLNRIEYENTIRDLFDVYVSVQQLLPKDNSAAGFDNVGAGLAVSAEAAAAYLRAADVTLDAVFGPVKKPRTIKHETNLLDQKTHDGKPFLAKQMGKMFRRTKDGLVIFQSNYCPTNLVNFARLRAPAGTYRGSIKVRAIQSKKPVTLRIYAGDTIVGRREKHLVGYYDIPPGKWTTIQFTDRLVQASGTFQPKCYGTRDTRKDADTYPEPGLEISDIVIEGPLEPWPPVSRTQLLGEIDLKTGKLSDATGILARLLPRAFRRPTTAAELEPYLALVESAFDAGRSFESALRLGVKAVLCSPEFLFLDEPTDAESRTIRQHALATRLSYFLWSSMPDRQLMSLADEGQLNDSKVLHSQVERLLKSSKAAAFKQNFVGQWLNLRDIDFTSPDMNLYPEFDELLKLSMVDETHSFFQEILREDLSVMNFIDSEFAFVNERLAQHYNIPGVVGQRIRRIKLPAGSVRGGVLTQASVLKVTANGTSTSPVSRGVWVMENLMGQTIPPPPNNVSAVEPDIRGAKTLRELLAKHRGAASCAVCHSRFDPAGFALENFDVIGGWRERYRTLGEGKRPAFSQHPITFAWVRYRIGLPVDATGQIPSGARFQNVSDFKQLLLKDKRSIATGLTRKLATYALGRRIGFSDRRAIEKIVNSVEKKNYGLRSLVHEIVRNESFQRP